MKDETVATGLLFAVLGGCGMAPDSGGAAEEESAATTSQLTSAISGSPSRCDWTQWAQSANHEGATCAVGQTPTRTLDRIEFDPFAPAEIAAADGGLFVHYQAPISDTAGNFYMVQKGGSFVACDPPDAFGPDCGFGPANFANETWSEVKYHMKRDGSVEPLWSFATDWKPYPMEVESMFQPALAGPLLYVPGAGGSVWQVLTIFDRAIPLQRILPFASVDPNTFVSGGIVVDDLGFLYWNVLQLDPDTQANHGFLIKASPTGKTWVVDYESLIPGAPAATDSCFLTFFDASPQPPFPFPPSVDALPPQAACGRQRPGLSVTPAIGRDGTIFTASTADFNEAYSYIVALRPDLSLAWATSLRGLVHDGCGVPQASPDEDAFCSQTFSAVGVDPRTNMAPALLVDDLSSSTPVALPDGGVAYGALDNYDGGRGHLVKLDRRGNFVATYNFGWDSTPAVYRHDGTYSFIIKDNHYSDDGPFFMTQLSADLQPEWSFVNTSTQTCIRQPDNTVQCSDSDPNGFTHSDGFEWCVNAPAVDAEGNVYANSEDGFVYEIGQGGVLKAQTFLTTSLASVYTPISLDSSGHVFAQNAGVLSILGR